MSVNFVTPLGRIVWGNPARSTKKTDQRTKKPVERDGQQVEQWVFGLAIPKDEFLKSVWPYLQQEAATAFPNGVPGNFAWKFKDGDSIDANGKPYADREGYAGHYVMTISTEAYAPPIWKNENGVYRQIDPNEIKTGDYVVVKLDCKYNGATSPNTPGVYVNPQGIELVGHGKEIITVSADPNEMFGGATYQLPPGASTTPVASNNAAAPFNTNPQQPAPAHDFVNNAGQPPAAAPVQQPAPQAAPASMPPAGNGMPPGMPQGR